jgi:hypothetical protein
MSQDQNQKKTCSVCHQSFNSDQELQDHQRTAHSQQKQGGNQQGNQPMSERNPGDQKQGGNQPMSERKPGDQKQEKIA